MYFYINKYCHNKDGHSRPVSHVTHQMSLQNIIYKVVK